MVTASGSATGQMIKNARPMIDDLGIGPNTRLSLELHRLSPIMKYRPDGIVTGAKSSYRGTPD